MRQIQIVRTPSGPLALVRPTAEKLLAEGVLSGTLDGDLHAADAATVKAAIMASAVCDFCSSPGASHYYDIPDFSMGALPNNYGAGRSTGGWMACDTCDALIAAGKRKQLVDHAVDTMAFPKFSRAAVEGLMEKFWAGYDERSEARGVANGVADFVEDRLVDLRPVPAMSKRDRRVEAVHRITGLTPEEIEQAVRGELGRDAVAKLVAWRRRFGLSSNVDLADLLTGNESHKPLPDVMPHWQRALEMRFSTLAGLQRLLKQDVTVFSQPTDLSNVRQVQAVVERARRAELLREIGVADDVKLLRVAETYSFNGETIAAIREAAQSIPRDAALSSIETPNTGAGWFWFGEPLPITASPIASDQVNALLWGWVQGQSEVYYNVTMDEQLLDKLPPEDVTRLRQLADAADVIRGKTFEIHRDEFVRMLKDAGVQTREQLERISTQEVRPGEPAIMFSAYVVDKRGLAMKAGEPAPSTRWYWPLSLSLQDMLAYNGASWDNEYGPGSPHAGEPRVSGKDVTLHCVEQLSLFFAMACVWFRQVIPGTGRKVEPKLVTEAGHVERHARKRYVREHKLDAVPTVQVVALRKTARTATEDAPSERQPGAREYHCRWVVQGHPRLQACGPGRKDRKLIWIDAHVAGPEDKPLKTRQKVYAVVR